MRFTPRELALGLAIIGAAAGIATLRPETTPYAYLFDVQQAETEEQRFLNAIVRHAGLTAAQLQPLMPRLRSVWRDLPTIVLVARESDRPLLDIVELRKSGLEWVEIHRRLKLPLKTLFAGLKNPVPDPYRAAWLEWRAKFRPALSDEQIRELALLQLARRITGKEVPEIAKQVARGTSARTIIARYAPLQQAEGQGQAAVGEPARPPSPPAAAASARAQR